MLLTIDTTGARVPTKREVRIIIQTDELRFAICMTPTFAEMLGSTLRAAAQDIELPDAHGQVYWAREVTKPF